MTRKQFGAVRLRHLSRLHDEAVRLFREVVALPNEQHRVPGLLHPSGVSRMRNGDSSCLLSRAALLMELVRDRHAGERVIAFLDGILEERFPAADVRWDDAVIAAAASDTTEDMREVRALLNPDSPADLAAWGESLDADIARAKVLRGAIRRREASMTVRRAA